MNTQYFYIFFNFTFVSPGQLGQKNGHRQLWSVQFLLKIYFLYNLFSISSLILFILFVSSNICSNKYYISILPGTLFICSQFVFKKTREVWLISLLMRIKLFPVCSQFYKDFILSSLSGRVICCYAHAPNTGNTRSFVRTSDII